MLIGLIGKARSGKDTVAEHLEMHHCFTRYAFADPMKSMLESVFGDLFRGGDREQPIDWLGKSPRQLMQTLGTEWGRNQVHPQLWTLLGEREVRLAKMRLNPQLVISDVRFHNEADMILRHGGTLIYVERDTAQAVNDHVSEQADWGNHPHLRLDNNGTLSMLHHRIDTLIENLKLKETA